MRRGILAFVVMLVAALAIGSCTAQPEVSSPTESDSAGKTDIASDSILLFDGNENSAKLVADMEAGNTPAECTVLYDMEGSLPTVTVTDEETIGEIYRRLAKVTVVGESTEAMTDCYHFVSFLLQDGTSVGYNFEGEDLLSGGKTNYEIKGGGPLWAYVRTLQADITGGKPAYAINLQDEAGVVLECQQSAEENQSVRIVCSTESSEDIHVYVNGEEITKSDEIYISVGGSDEKTPAQKRKFEFIMPASDVELVVTVGSSAS